MDLVGEFGAWQVEEVVDIGGGYGELLAEIISANPFIKKGTSFDVVQVIARAEVVWQQGSYAKRYGKAVKEKIVFHSGDMFSTSTYPVPSARTAFFMRMAHVACHTSHVTRHTSHVTHFR